MTYRTRYLVQLFFLILFLHHAVGQCTVPTLPAYSYTLTSQKSSYSPGEFYEIFCKPGYTMTGSSNLTCTGTAWSPDLPSCAASELFPWWVFLVVVIAAIILIPCILPRVWACICNKKKTEDDEQPLTKEKGKYSGKGGIESPGIWRKNKPITPVTDNGKHKLSQLGALQNTFPGSVNPSSKNAYF